MAASAAITTSPTAPPEEAPRFLATVALFTYAQKLRKLGSFGRHDHAGRLTLE
jgi:hypothetical protein